MAEAVSSDAAAADPSKDFRFLGTNLTKPGPGRPKGSGIDKMKHEFKKLCMDHSVAAFQVLLDVANNKKAPAAARVAAANSILDRAHGKPIQTIVGDADSPPLVAVQVIYAGGQDIINGTTKFQNLSPPLEQLPLDEEDYETGDD